MLDAATRQGLAEQYGVVEDGEAEAEAEEEVMMASHCSTVAARTVVVEDDVTALVASTTTSDIRISVAMSHNSPASTVATEDKC